MSPEEHKTGPPDAESPDLEGEDALLLALAAGATVRAAALKAAVSKSTATRRLADPAFRRRVQDARAELVARALGKLAGASSRAVETLRKLLKANSDVVKLNAARRCWSWVTDSGEAVEVEKRVAELSAGQPAGGRP